MNYNTDIQILFVDDDPLILSGLRRQCRRLRPDWNTRFAESGDQALSMLHEMAVDVVVSDMRMPEMSGAELLEAVRDEWPSTHRIILSGQTDQSSLLEHIGCIHRYLQKPCDVNQILRAIEQSLGLKYALHSSRLESTVARIETLPVMSSVHRELIEAFNDDDVSVDTVAEIVARDGGLCVKVLQLVNSAFFCSPTRIDTVSDAVHRLGLRNLKSMAMTAKIFDALETSDNRNSSLAQLWTASAEIGTRASALAKVNKQPASICSHAQLAGMLSLIGRAAIIAFEPESMQEALNKAEADDIPLYQAESDVFGVSQHIIGAYALGIWAFDDIITESVLWQDNPFTEQGIVLSHPSVYVHAARTMQAPSNLIETFEPDLKEMESIGFNISAINSLRSAA